MQGWVSFHRQIMKWEWYTDPNTFRLFFHLVLNANHEKASWRGIEIERGQFITSPDKLATQLDLSRQQIRTALKKLELTNEVTTKSTNKYTVVTVEKYDFYQDDARTSTNKPTNQQPTNNQQITTNNNEYNKKNENKVILWGLVNEFSSELKQAYVDFNIMRNKIKKPMTQRALVTIINKVNKLANNDETKINILDQSIEKCWQTVFELKEDGFNKNVKEVRKVNSTWND